MNNEDVAKLLLNLISEYSSFYKGTTVGGSVGASVRAVIEGKTINAVALTNCPSGVVNIIKSSDNKYYAIGNEFNSLVSQYYTRYRQKKEISKIYTGKVNVQNYNVPILFSKEEIKIPVLYKKNKTDFGDAAVLFHVLHSNPGQHPDSLCHCNYWMPTDQGCIRTCSGTGSFKTVQECEEYRDKRKTGLLKYYHTTGEVDFRNDGKPYTGYKLNTSLYKRFSYDLAAEGNMYIIKSKLENYDMDGYDSISQRFWRYTENRSKQYYEWYDLNIYYVGIQRLYNNLSSSGSITSTYKTITQKESKINYPGLTFNSLLPTEPYTITGKVWQQGWRYHYFRTRLKETDDPMPSPPSPGSPDWTNYTVPDWVNGIPWGNILGWAEEVISIKPPPLGTNQPGLQSNDQPNRYLTIKYYVGGHSKDPIYLGEYLTYYNSTVDPFYERQTATTDCYESSLDDPSYGSTIGGLVKAYISAVGKNEYEVVIKYGTFSKYKDIYPSRSFSAFTVNSYFWCHIDVFSIKGSTLSKQTYNYPDDVKLHPNNWLAKFLKNWVKIDYDFNYPQYPFYEELPYSDNINNFSNGVRFNPTQAYYENKAISLGYENIEEAIQLTRFLSFNSSTFNYSQISKYVMDNSTSRRIKILGAEAGKIPFKNNTASFIGVNFIKDNDINNSYAVDCDGNQWTGAGVFTDEIKNKTLTNIPIRVGKLKGLLFSYDIDNSEPNSFVADVGYSDSSPLLFISGGTAYLTKVFSLNTPVCGIKQIVSWMNIDTITSIDKPFYSYLIKTSFDVEDTKQVYTFNSNSIVTQYRPEVWTPYGSTRENRFIWPDIELNKPSFDISGGWPYYTYYTQLHPFNQGGDIPFPLVLKNESEEIIATINSTEVVVIAGDDNYSLNLSAQERSTIYVKGCIVVGVCLNE